MVSPAAALPITPLIVPHGSSVLLHELASLPVVVTYQVAPVRVISSLEESRTAVSSIDIVSSSGLGVTSTSGVSIGRGVSAGTVVSVGSGVSVGNGVGVDSGS